MSDTLTDALRSRGMRMTAQRQLVLDAVRRLGHATPEQLHAEVTTVASGVNITTIYRTLELLEELGLVTHTHLSHGAPTYHPAGDAAHVHLVCRSCGRIREVATEKFAPVATMLRDEHGFEPDIGHQAFFGTCTECES